MGIKEANYVADSTMSTEFIALASTCKEAKWLRNLLCEIPLSPKPMSPLSLPCDSVSVLERAYSNVYYGKSRHIGLCHNYMQQLIKDGVITMDYVHSAQNLANPLTKGLARDLVIKTAKRMGLKSISKDIYYENST